MFIETNKSRSKTQDNVKEVYLEWVNKNNESKWGFIKNLKELWQLTLQKV